MVGLDSSFSTARGEHASVSSNASSQALAPTTVESRDTTPKRVRRERRLSRHVAGSCALLSLTAVAFVNLRSPSDSNAAARGVENAGGEDVVFDPRRELATARSESESGDRAAARRRWYALLVVVDRIEDRRERSDVEARALYGIAASYVTPEAGR